MANGQSYYMEGWRIASAYLHGRIDMGDREAGRTSVMFPDAYAAHYHAQRSSPIPNVEAVHRAYKQWKLMQTMSKETESITVSVPPCERSE